MNILCGHGRKKRTTKIKRQVTLHPEDGLGRSILANRGEEGIAREKKMDNFGIIEVVHYGDP